jgi:hypothetical protein
MALPGRKVRHPDQGPVDAGRGNLKMVGLVDQVFDVERRRDRAAQLLAIGHRHGAVLALSHDLQRQPVLAGKPNPHEAKTHRAQQRPDQRGDARLDAAFADQAVIVLCRGAFFVGHEVSDGVAGNKKERDRRDPLFVIATKNLKPI